LSGLFTTLSKTLYVGNSHREGSKLGLQTSLGLEEILMGYKEVVQYARWKNDFQNLNNLRPEDVPMAKNLLKALDEPLYLRWILFNQPQGKNIIEHDFFDYVLSPPPQASDPILNVALELLVKDFLHYLEKNYFAVIKNQGSGLEISTFDPIDLDQSFWEFLGSTYDDSYLQSRWALIQSVYRLRQYPRLPSPILLRNMIIKEKIPLPVTREIGSFGDVVAGCMFCGRESKTFEVKKEYVEFASQRPQSRILNKNASFCPICLFASYISPIRNPNNCITLKANYEKEEFSHLFNRIFGMSIGNLTTISFHSRLVSSYGKTALTYLAASRIPLNILVDPNFDVINTVTASPLKKKKVLAMKAFDPILGYEVFTRRIRGSNPLEREFKKALWAIMNDEYFSLLPSVGFLATNLASRKRELLLDNGIFELIQNEVIEMEERPDIVFGTALLLDAFLPKTWKDTEDLKTEVRKVAYYLENPEQALYRLMQITGKDYATIEQSFRNKTQFKLLRDLLIKIHQEENLGDFEKEQEERKKWIEESGGSSYDETERLFLYHDDILKVYMYIQDLLVAEEADPRRRKKKFSDLMTRVKYALIAKRIELIGGM
jgi:hypothetical protein